MKVLFLQGGVPHYLSALFKKLSEKYSIDLTVVHPGNKGKTVGEGIKFTESASNYKLILAEEEKSIFGKVFFKDFYPTLKSEKPDIIVLGWPYILKFCFSFRISWYIRKNKVGVIYREIPFQVAPANRPFSYYKNNPLINEQGEDITPKGYKFYLWASFLWALRKWYYNKVDATITYTDLAYEIHQSYGIKKNKIFVSNNSINTDELFSVKEKLLSQPETLYNPYRLIHIGRLVKWKRVDLIIKILPELKIKYSNTELIVIGNGPEENNLKKMANEFGVSHFVTFAGGIYGYEKLGQYLLSSGIYVLAGMGGLSINEAMAFGKPVICSVCDGTEKKLIRDGYNGFFFENGNAESLLKKIEFLFSNPSIISEFGKNSERIIHNEININTVTDVFNQAFNFVINMKNK